MFLYVKIISNKFFSNSTFFSLFDSKTKQLIVSTVDNRDLKFPYGYTIFCNYSCEAEQLMQKNLCEFTSVPYFIFYSAHISEYISKATQDPNCLHKNVPTEMFSDYYKTSQWACNLVARGITEISPIDPFICNFYSPYQIFYAYGSVNLLFF